MDPIDNSGLDGSPDSPDSDVQEWIDEAPIDTPSKLDALDSLRYKPNSHLQEMHGNAIHLTRLLLEDTSSTPPSAYALQMRLEGFKRSAERRGISWQLTDAEALTLFKSPCAYCGQASCPTSINGIDRVANAKGYLPQNSVPCCSACNAHKGRHDVLQWAHQCLCVARHLLTSEQGIALPDGSVIRGEATVDYLRTERLTVRS